MPFVTPRLCCRMQSLGAQVESLCYDSKFETDQKSASAHQSGFILKKIASDPMNRQFLVRAHRYGQQCQVSCTSKCRTRLEKNFGTQLPERVPAIAIVTQLSSLQICECPPAALGSSLIGVVFEDGVVVAFRNDGPFASFYRTDSSIIFCVSENPKRLCIATNRMVPKLSQQRHFPTW